MTRKRENIFLGIWAIVLGILFLFSLLFNLRFGKIIFPSIVTPTIKLMPTGTLTPTVTPTVRPRPTIIPTLRPTLIPTRIPPTPTSSIFNSRVLFIGYNPAENGVTLADKYYISQMGGRTAKQMEDHVVSNTVNMFKQLSQNMINFQIVKKIDISTFQPNTDGFIYNFTNYESCTRTGHNCDSRTPYFDYPRWLKENNICQIAEENNVDEIWMLSVSSIMQWESFMIGPDYGFDVNGGVYTAAGCKKHYAVLNGVYDRSENFLHNYGHRIEATMRYLTDLWMDQDKQNYLEKFISLGRYQTPDDPYSGLTCGNVHFPANASRAYDVSSRSNKEFNCSDWNNFPDFKGNKENINCEAWGCTDEGWQMYWFKRLPRNGGEITMKSRTGVNFSMKRNWWYYLLFPENAICLRKSEQGISCK